MPTFKPGDAVRIKSGISSETHEDDEPGFMPAMNEYKGMKLTVWMNEDYIRGGKEINCVELVENDDWAFHVKWLEPWNDDESWNGTEWVKKC